MVFVVVLEFAQQISFLIFSCENHFKINKSGIIFLTLNCEKQYEEG